MNEQAPDADRFTWKAVRDVVLFIGGVAGVAHQTLIAPEPNATLLLLFASMMGLPAFLKRDAKKEEA